MHVNLKNQNMSPGNQDSRLIYVVDDEPMLLDMARHVLEAEGYRVNTYRNPTAALLAYKVEPRRPCIILTDFQMRQMNGVELTAACRRINPEVKVAVVSGSMESDDFTHFKDKPDGFLAKPYNHRQLIRLVRTLAN